MNREKHALMLLKAALADTDAVLIEHWRDWRSCNPVIDHLSSTEYRLLPYVWSRLRMTSDEDAGDAKLRGVYKRVWLHNHRLIEQAAGIQRGFAEAGIHSLLFKGMALLAGTFQDHGSRSTSDIDILVNRDDMAKAGRLLAVLRPQLEYNDHAVAYSSPVLPSADLHCMPAAPGAVRTPETAAIVSAAIRRGENSVHQGRRLFIAEPTDRLFLQCLNQFAHSPRPGVESAYWLVDLRESFLQAPPDMDRMVEMIKSSGATALFQSVLDDCSDLVPAPAAEFADRIAAMPLGAHGRKVRSALATIALGATPQDDPALDRNWRYALSGYQLGEAPLPLRMRYAASRTRYVLRNAFASPDRRRILLRQPRHYLSKALTIFRD